MKRCSRCEEWKPFEAFHQDASRHDGLKHACKECRGCNPTAQLVVQRESWQQDAACRGLDPDLFFPERGEPTQEAKDVCSSCPVQFQCLEYSIRTNETAGIWGGKSTRQRRDIRRNRKQGAVA